MLFTTHPVSLSAHLVHLTYIQEDKKEATKNHTEKCFTQSNRQVIGLVSYTLLYGETQNWSVPAIKPLSALSAAGPWTWIALEVHYMWTCLKKDAEIRKTLFQYSNNTFQLPSLLLDVKNLFQQRKDFVRKHTLEDIWDLGSGWFEIWSCRITFFKPGVSQAVLIFTELSEHKRTFKGGVGFHTTIACLMRNG